ncbi:hypothetical protein AB0K00_21590 [Dactylosporangium sp. NPDC049525]|uniref:hypothetical protein n=1 Tax=Dactylosporangium sp. NPDC049525 TaxID=3154730 RepID=UPI003448A1FE
MTGVPHRDATNGFQFAAHIIASLAAPTTRARTVCRVLGLLVLAGAVLIVAFIGPSAVEPGSHSYSGTTWLRRSGVPDWASAAGQPARTVAMNVRVDGDADKFTVRIDYELRLPADDDLVDQIRGGWVKSGELAKYLAGGPASTPVSLERSEADAWAIARFRFVGTDSQTLDLGRDEDLASPAAAATNRTLTITVQPGMIGSISPQPSSQDSHSARFEGPPESVYFSVSSDGPDPYAAAEPSGPVDLLFRLVTRAVPVWMLAMLLPWLVVLRGARWSAHGWLPALRVLGPVAVGVMAAGIGLVVPLRFGFAETIVASIALAAAPVLLGGVILTINGRPFWSRSAVVGVLVVAAVFLGAGIVLSPVGGGTVSWAVLGTSLAAAAALSGAGAALCFRWTDGVFGAALGLMTATCSFFLDVLRGLEINEIVPTMLLGVTAIGLLVVRTSRVGLPARRLAAFAGVAAGSLLFVPIVGLLTDPTTTLEDYFFFFGPSILIVAGHLLSLALGVTAIVLLRRAGRSGAALRNPVIAAIGLVLLLIAATDTLPFRWLDLVSVAVLIVAWRLVAPPDRRRQAARLANVSRASHDELVTAEARRRLVQASAHDLYRKSRGRLGSAETSLTEYDREQDELDSAARARGQLIAGVPVHQALSTGGGATPWRNGLRAASYAIPAALLLIGYEIFAFTRVAGSDLFAQAPTVVLVDFGRHLARWFVYALIFGYFYPLLRGVGPVAKAFAFGAAILATELLPMLDGEGIGASDLSASPRDIVVAAAIRVGQLIVFVATLGLLWERRLAHAADYPWDRLRNIRSLRALAAPISTIAIAVLTTVGTAFAGAAVVALLAGGASVQPPTTDPATTSTPR